MSENEEEKSEWNEEILGPLGGFDLYGGKKEDDNYDSGAIVQIEGWDKPKIDLEEYKRLKEERDRLLREKEKLETKTKAIQDRNVRLAAEKAAEEERRRQMEEEENRRQYEEWKKQREKEKSVSKKEETATPKAESEPKTGGLGKSLIIALLVAFGIVSYKMYDKKNADLQAQLADKDKQIETLKKQEPTAQPAETKVIVKTEYVKDPKTEQELATAKKEIERLKKQPKNPESKPPRTQPQQAATTAVARQSTASKYKVGDKITFGSWPVGVEGETAHPIEWEILEKKNDGTAIILSSKVIDSKPYNTESKDITWAESSLRRWLNGEFYSNAFTPKEKDAIVEARLKNLDNNEVYTQAYIDWWKKWGYYSEGDEERYLGKRMNGKGGVDTTDNVWLLSLDDMKRYGRRFSTDASRIGKPMEYLKKKWNFCTSEACKRNGAVGNAWWWLRSPGLIQNYVAYVYYDGFVNAAGSRVGFEHGGVRAALKINLNNL